MTGLSRRSDASIFSVMPAGTVLPFGGDVAPLGWAICNGSTKKRTKYPDLFLALGEKHGSGDGSTTFHLPDYRGRFLRGVDDSQGRDPDAAGRTAANAGGNTGDNVGSVQGHAVENIKGTFGVKSAESYATVPFADIGASPGITNASGVAGSGTLYELDASTQVETSTEARPKNAAVNYIIKLGTPLIVPVVPLISTVEGSPTSATPIPFTVDFGEDVSGFVIGDIIATNGTVSNFAGGAQTYSFDVTPTADGNVNVTIPAGVVTTTADNAQNAEAQYNITYTAVVITPYSANFNATTMSGSIATPQGSGFSISTWVKVDPFAAGGTVFFLPQGPNDLRLNITNISIEASNKNGSIVYPYAITQQNPNSWHHLGYTNDGGTNNYLYINGVEVGSFASVGGTIDMSGGFTVGNGISIFDGNIANLELWSTQLNQTDFENLYEAGYYQDPIAAGAAGVLLAHWRMGDDDNPLAGVITDQGPFSHDLTIGGVTPALVASVPLAPEIYYENEFAGALQPYETSLQPDGVTPANPSVGTINCDFNLLASGEYTLAIDVAAYNIAASKTLAYDDKLRFSVRVVDPDQTGTGDGPFDFRAIVENSTAAPDEIVTGAVLISDAIGTFDLILDELVLGFPLSAVTKVTLGIKQNPFGANGGSIKLDYFKIDKILD